VSVQRWNDYEKRFAPLENRIIAQTQNLTSPANEALTHGLAHTATEQQFAGARQQLNQNLFAHGLNPASGSYQARLGQLSTNEANASGMSAADAGLSLAQQKRAGLENITQIGRGQSGQAMNMMGNQAQNAQQQAIFDARQALDASMANQNLIGTVAGAGAGYAFHHFNQGGSEQSGLGAATQGLTY